VSHCFSRDTRFFNVRHRTVAAFAIWQTPPLERKVMNRNAGLWIDHKEAIIVFATSEADGAEETKRMQSGMEKHVRYSGRAASEGVAEDQRDRKFASDLDLYYDEVIAQLKDATSILIFGPGEAKGEFKKRMEHKGLGDAIVGVETTDKMTDNQIAAKVREHYKK
jgi:hypothetical protein